MIEYLDNINFEDYLNKDIFFEFYKTKSQQQNSDLLKEIETHEKICDFFSEYTKQDINSICKTVRSLDNKLSKIINPDEHIDIKESHNYIVALSRMLLLLIFLIKLKKVIREKLNKMLKFLLNNFSIDNLNDLYIQNYYQLSEIMKIYFNKELENDNYLLTKNIEKILLEKMNNNNIGEGESTPKFTREDSKVSKITNFQKDLKGNKNENSNISFNDSNFGNNNQIMSVFTLKKEDYDTKNKKLQTSIKKNNDNNNSQNKMKTLKKKETSSTPMNKNSINVDKKYLKRNSIYSTKSKKQLLFSSYLLDKKDNFCSDKNLKKTVNNLHNSQKGHYSKKMTSKEVFVELFVLANELYKDQKINEEEKIVFKQLIINKSEKLLQIFYDNKDNRNDLVNCIKEVISKIIKK
jgi:hypothetical protein